MTFRAILIAGLLSTTGCAGCWENRARDAGDVFGFGILGGGFGASARVTQFVQAGLLFDMNMERQIRFVGRQGRFAPVNASEVGIAPIAYFRGELEGRWLRAMALGRTYVSNSEEEPEWAFVPSRERYEKGYDRRLWDVGVSVHAIIGFDLEVNLLELGDFFLGIAGFDPLGDDEGPLSPPEPDSDTPARAAGRAERAISELIRDEDWLPPPRQAAGDGDRRRPHRGRRTVAELAAEWLEIKRRAVTPALENRRYLVAT